MKSKSFLFFIAFIISGYSFTQNTNVKVGFSNELRPMRMEQMALGQGGLSEKPMLERKVNEIRALNPAIIRIFVSEYYNVLPEKGKYHFATLDSMISSILRAGAQPMMSFCLKPKLFYPVIDQDIVEPDNYAEWEQFVYDVVTHYLDYGAGIKYWEIGNEVDIGEDGGTPYRFKPESYVRYYKHTTAAILRADPTAKVGGPALAYYKSPILPELLNAASNQHLPLDFVSWHGYNNDPVAFRRQIEYVKNLLSRYPDLDPETIIDEWNQDLINPPLDPEFQPCFILETIWQMKDAGLDWSCYYHIQDWYVSYETFEKIHSVDGTAFMVRWWNRQPQFSGLFDYQGQVRPAYFSFKLLSRMAGQQIEVNSSDETVHGFATHDYKLQMYNLLLWNFSEKPTTVNLILEDIPKDMLMRHVILNTSGFIVEENQILKPEPRIQIEKGNQFLSLKLKPFAVHYWAFE